VRPNESALSSPPHDGGALSADTLLVERLRQGDAEAGRRFVREYYPGIYRYLLYLTGRRDAAEDLTQETFLHAWRRLDHFVVRAPLRVWLCRIAHREFLQALRSQRPQSSLEEVAELPSPHLTERTEAMELREVIRKLPREEGEILVLHHLQGYNCREIAQIVGAPVSTVKYRLLTARAHLQRELGEGDLAYLNEPGMTMRQWAWLPLDQMHDLEARLGTAWEARKESEMERREFLRRAAAGAAGLMLAEQEIIDDRLTRKVTLALKGTALSDLCQQLRGETGIQLTAGPSVSDEKVTLFCEKQALRDLMRQLSRPFGYTWLRSGKAGEYRYELVQDLRSQLLEEELRNRDRNAALLALERELQRYRPFLDLPPDEVRARAKTALPEEKRLLEVLAGANWGALKLYFRLSPQELAALRGGQDLTFSQEPQPGEQPLPPDLARGVLQTVQRRVLMREHGWDLTSVNDPNGLPLTVVPEARPFVILRLFQTELGRFAFEGNSGYRVRFNPWTGGSASSLTSSGPAAVGQSSALRGPGNRVANARLASDAALRPQVSLKPQPSCGVNPSLGAPPSRRHAGGTPALPGKREELPLSAAGRGLGGGVNAGGGNPETRVTSADVLEALHRATGLPIIADFYTRLYAPEVASVQSQPLFDALNQVADAMHLRWNKEGKWLQFRSAVFYDDRLKEVPNALLARWSVSRRKHGAPPLDDLIEIAELSDAQLDAERMAEGARACWGLVEWDLSRQRNSRSDFRYLAQLTPAQRQVAQSPTGLSFRQMSLTQQQQFIATPLGFLTDKESSEVAAAELRDLSGASLRVTCRQPGGFCCKVLSGVGRPRIRFPVEQMLRVQAPTRQEALEAARRIDPQVEEAQIVPSEPAVTIEYLWGGPGTTLNGVALHATADDARIYFLRKTPDRGGLAGTK
jgi:RNA polymerase sigma-70 factor, ECF subfamily